MCLDPASMTMIGLAVSAASAGASFIGGQQQADAQAKVQKQQAIAANNAFAQTSAQISQRGVQEQGAAGAKALRERVATMRAESAARVAAGEGGVSGVSVNNLLADISGQGSRSLDAINQNLGAVNLDLAHQQNSAFATAQGRNNAARTPINQPSFISLGLDIAGATRDADTQARRNSPDGTGLFG